MVTSQEDPPHRSQLWALAPRADAVNILPGPACRLPFMPNPAMDTSLLSWGVIWLLEAVSFELMDQHHWLYLWVNSCVKNMPWSSMLLRDVLKGIDIHTNATNCILEYKAKFLWTFKWMQETSNISELPLPCFTGRYSRPLLLKLRLMQSLQLWGPMNVGITRNPRHLVRGEEQEVTLRCSPVKGHS